ncbi:MAG TPA: hypothetical protein VEA16_20000 [Vicinamibacterales bacterium]|nr:hypothetical protein [Vicinamibacterales bacterium]
MVDNYTKTVLTVIAGALIYLCIAMTSFPAAHAQGTTQRPGEFSGPAEVIVTGWKSTAPIPITASEPMRVVTERISGAVDRVVLVGWEQSATPEKPSGPKGFVALPNSSGSRALPVTQQ